MPNRAFGMSKDFIRKDLEVDLEFSTTFFTAISDRTVHPFLTLHDAETSVL